MKLCIDTNAYSDFKRGHKLITNLLEDADRVMLPTIVLGELYSGFALGSRANQNRAEFLDFCKKPGVFVAPVDDAIAKRYGFLITELKNQGTPLPTNDIWIAVAAMEHGYILLSRDTHFKDIRGLMVLPQST